jgi:DNA-binding XRE family transcriptional regulator
MATKPWDSSKYINPENVERINAHMDQMLAEVRAYRLREAREQQHLTQQQVADAMGVSKVRVSQLEHGELDASEVRTIAKYVEALGGKLRMIADFGDAKFIIG